MNETVTRQRPSIDLDDFERRLQAQSHRHHEDDPLAELARIVGEQPDPYDDVFAQPQAASPALRPSFAPHARQEPSLGAPSLGAPSLGAPSPGTPSLGAAPPRFSADFAAIEAGLRGAAPQPMRQPAPPVYAEPAHDLEAAFGQAGYVEPGYDPDPQMQAMPEASWADPVRAPARHGTRRPVYAMAASIAIAVVGIGVAFAYKGTGASPREIRTIMAAAGPTKIQPPAEQGSDQAAQDPDALGQQPAPTKLVSREEQPVDLSQAVQDNAARDAASRGTDAASVPVPLSPGQAAGTSYPDYSALEGKTPAAAAPDATGAGAASPAAYGDQGFGVGMPKPKRVKSVTVRPDGTIVNNETPSAAPIDKVASDQAPPVVDAPSAPAAPASKISNRASTHAIAVAPPADEADAPAPAPVKTAKKAKPVRVASAETGATDAAADATEEPKPAGAGAFAVQLAAPGSEADARSVTSKFLKKYAGALHGHRLGFHRAESNGRTVYRVRVSSLTREDAASLCGKLKSEGGTCFVARD